MCFNTIKSGQSTPQRVGNGSELLLIGEPCVKISQQPKDILNQAHVKWCKDRYKEYNIGQNTILYNGATSSLGGRVH